MSCPVYELGRIAEEGRIAAQGLAEHRSAGGEQLHCASLVFSWVIFHSLFVVFLFITTTTTIVIIFYFLSQLLNCSYLNPQVSLVCDSPPHPPPRGGRGEEGVSGCVVLIAGWGETTAVLYITLH